MRVRLVNEMRAVGSIAALVVTLCSFSAVPAVAQRLAANEAIAPFSTFYLSTGTLLMDVSRLNPHFERNDLPVAERPGYFTLSNDGYSVGLGGYGVVMSRVVLGGEFHSAGLGQESSPSGRTNQLATTYWMGTVGYAAWTTWRINLVPFLGIGRGSATLTLENRDGGPTVSDTQDPIFDEVIMSPGTRSEMTGSYVMVQPGLNVDFLILRQESSQLGLVLGLHVASMISPNRTTWTYSGRSVFGAPDLGPSGGSVRVVAGIGGFRLGGPAAISR